jgi:hypothetical protein
MTQQTSTPPFHDADLNRESVHTILRAARFAIRAYPGPVGELIERELRAYVDTGRQLPPDARPERLLAILLQALEEERKAATASPRHTLPARYRKGTPLHWEYTASPAAPAEAQEE